MIERFIPFECLYIEVNQESESGAADTVLRKPILEVQDQRVDALQSLAH